MKIMLKPKTTVFHWFPFICAEQAGGSTLFKGRTYLWMFWMIICDDYIKGDSK